MTVLMALAANMLNHDVHTVYTNEDTYKCALLADGLRFEGKMHYEVYPGNVARVPSKIRNLMLSAEEMAGQSGHIGW